jgi:hypothetical protein
LTLKQIQNGSWIDALARMVQDDARVGVSYSPSRFQIAVVSPA